MSITCLTHPLKLFLGSIQHESNSFSPLPTGLDAFTNHVFVRPCRGAVSTIGQVIGYAELHAIAERRGDRIVEGLGTWAMPSGPLAGTTYEALKAMLLEDLREAGPVDAVLLALHGAMIAEGYDDCEGDILNAVRMAVGPEIPIGVLLDLHGNMSQAMVDSGAIMIACKEYPHIDYAKRAEELFTIIDDIIAGRALPQTVLERVPVIGLIGTTQEPTRAFVQAMHDAETGPIRSISMMHGFPWADTEDGGASIIVIHDQGHERVARAVAAELGATFAECIKSMPMTYLSIEAAIDAACAASAGDGPVVIADSSDNAGGGAASDSTFLLRALINRGIENVAIGMIWDPQAVAIAAQAGAGSTLQLRLGGKIGPLSGDPIDLTVKVMMVRDDVTQSGFSVGQRFPIGSAAWLRTGSVDILVNSNRQQPLGPDCFIDMGIDVQQRDIVVVKSSEHFRIGFDPIARQIIYCSAPGTLSNIFEDLPYSRIRRPIWPLDGRGSANGEAR